MDFGRLQGISLLHATVFFFPLSTQIWPATAALRHMQQTETLTISVARKSCNFYCTGARARTKHRKIFFSSVLHTVQNDLAVGNINQAYCSLHELHKPYINMKIHIVTGYFEYFICSVVASFYIWSFLTLNAAVPVLSVKCSYQ